jgi:hypothetical protein
MTLDHDDEPNADHQYRAALQALTSPLFRDAPATQKQEILWKFISGQPYQELPPLNSTALQLLFRLLNRSNLRKAFDVNEDVRPPRTKPFHPLGTVAKIRFVAHAGHPFTGIFASGAIGFARLSLTMGLANYGPSTAFKFMIDGPNRSESLVLDQSVDTQTSRDFFERAPTNQTIWPTTYPLKMVWFLVNWWLSPITDPMYQPLDHLGAIFADGRKVDRINAPKLIYFYGADELHNDPQTTQDFREMLAEVPSGTLLYHVFCRTDQAAKQIYLGFIKTESEFVASEFGDRILSLRHTPVAGRTNPGN